MPHSHMILPFSIPGGLAGLARGLGNGWPAVEQRANHVLALLATAPRQRTKPAVLLVQLLAYVTVHRDNTPEPVPSQVLALLLRALSAVLDVSDVHARRASVLATTPSNAVAAAELGVAERTVRRWRTYGVGAPVSSDPNVIAAAYLKGHTQDAHDTLFALATEESRRGKYFSSDLLWSLAEVLGVARRDSGLTRGATEVLHGGLRNPHAFIHAGVGDGTHDLEREVGRVLSEWSAAEGHPTATVTDHERSENAQVEATRRMLLARSKRGLEGHPPEAPATYINALAEEAGANRDSIRRWREPDSVHAGAYELNRLNPATFVTFNASGGGRRTAEAEAFLAAAKAALVAALAGRRGSADRDTLKTALLLRRLGPDHTVAGALQRHAPQALAEFLAMAPRRRRS